MGHLSGVLIPLSDGAAPFSFPSPGSRFALATLSPREANAPPPVCRGAREAPHWLSPRFAKQRGDGAPVGATSWTVVTSLAGRRAFRRSIAAIFAWTSVVARLRQTIGAAS